MGCFFAGLFVVPFLWDKLAAGFLQQYSSVETEIACLFRLPIKIRYLHQPSLYMSCAAAIFFLLSFKHQYRSIP